MHLGKECRAFKDRWLNDLIKFIDECITASEDPSSVCTPMRGQMTVYYDVFSEVCDQDVLQKVSDELEAEILFQVGRDRCCHCWVCTNSVCPFRAFSRYKKEWSLTPTLSPVII